MPRAAPALLALTLVLAGCLAPAALDAGSRKGPATPFPVVDGGGLAMEVPLTVFLVGFEPGTAAPLEARLTPEPVAHAHASWVSVLRSGRADADTIVNDPHAYARVPATFAATYRVVERDVAFAASYFDAVAPSPVADGLYDANLAEALLVDRLAAAGHPPQPGRAALAVLHAGPHLPEDHAWRHTLTHGFLEPVRYFGERSWLAILDASARPDPRVTGDEVVLSPPYLLERVEPRPARAYDQPLAPGGEATVEALERLARDATHHRLLQGAVFPVATAPCHAVTVLVAAHGHAASEHRPGARAAEEWFDVDALARGWSNLTGEDVRVVLRRSDLPQDDPALDIALRATSGPLMALHGGAYDLLYETIDARWERYVEPGRGCEEYLALAYFPDAGHAPTARLGPSGNAMFEPESGRRFTLVVINDVDRLRAEYDGPASDVLGTRDPSAVPNRPAKVVLHEVGHLFGAHHPFIAQHAEGADASPRASVVHTFGSGWSAMSYQVGERQLDFGAVDRTNWERNRAAYALAEAQARGLEDAPAFAAALDAIAAYDWPRAYDALAPVLSGAATLGSSASFPLAISPLPEAPPWIPTPHPRPR